MSSPKSQKSAKKAKTPKTKKPKSKTPKAKKTPRERFLKFFFNTGHGYFQLISLIYMIFFSKKGSKGLKKDLLYGHFVLENFSSSIFVDKLSHVSKRGIDRLDSSRIRQFLKFSITIRSISGI